jgi:hypothetical protein
MKDVDPLAAGTPRANSERFPLQDKAVDRGRSCGRRLPGRLHVPVVNGLDRPGPEMTPTGFRNT